MLKYAESMGVIRRSAHELGDIVQMTEDSSVLTSYFRNNSLHLMLMPSLLACAFLNNTSVFRADLVRLARRVYPYVAEEYFRLAEYALDSSTTVARELGNQAVERR